MSIEKKIAAGKFKATCLALLDEVQTSGEEIIVTKYGKPVAKIVPVDAEKLDQFKNLKGSVTIKEDIIAPMGENTWGSLQ